VKKLSRLFLIGIGAVLGIAIILLLAVNLYVQSQATQARIQQELSQRLNTPLHIRQISVTPWGGLKLSGITIPQTTLGATGDFLDAKTFRLRIRFSSLFSQRLVIKEVSLIKPNVVWIQNADGKWRLPEAAPQAQPPIEAEESIAIPATPPTTPSRVIAKVHTPRPQIQPAGKAEKQEPAPYAPEIRRVKLTDGDFNFLDEKGKVVARFTGVDFRSSLRSTTALNGTIEIEKTSLRDKFFLEELQSPLRYDPTVLDLAKVSAKADDGEITGGFTMRPQEEDSPFTARIQFHNLQADRIVTEAGGSKGMVKGRLEGMLEAAGKTADPNALTGHGEFTLRDGEVQQYSLLVALGQILQIEELTQLHLEQAEVKYHLSPGLITVDQLVLRSPNIRLSATGTITFAGKLRLESQLAINEKIRGQLFRAIRDNFQPTKEPGYAAVSFQVTGNVDHPKTNLMDKVVGGDLKNLGGVLNSLFGGGKSDRSKKKKHSDENVAEPAESPPAETATPSATP
jgi:type II secretion system protein N